MHLRSNRVLSRAPAPAIWLGVALLYAQAATAQTTPPQPAPGNPARPVESSPAGQTASDEVAIFSTDTRLVLLPVTVVDKNGKLLTTIPQSAFKVYENGVEQPLKLFR